MSEKESTTGSEGNAHDKEKVRGHLRDVRHGWFLGWRFESHQQVW